MDGFPRYHELPEPDARVRGYNATRITDEKPFHLDLGTHQEQAVKDVINNDFVEPLAREAAERITRRFRENHVTLNMEALQKEVAKEIKRLDDNAEAARKTRQLREEQEANAQIEANKRGGYLVPKPLLLGEHDAYALSALADVAGFVQQQHGKKAYIFIPFAQGDLEPNDAHNQPAAPPRLAPPQPTRPRYSLEAFTRRMPLKPTPPRSIQPVQGAVMAPPLVQPDPIQPANFVLTPATRGAYDSLLATGEYGAEIAAPGTEDDSEVRQLFRANNGGLSTASYTPFPPTTAPRTPRQAGLAGQQFLFHNSTPPQPQQPTTRANTPKTTVQKPVQFINSTVESRKAASAAGNTERKGGQRMLLPKGQ